MTKTTYKQIDLAGWEKVGEGWHTHVKIVSFVHTTMQNLTLR